MKRIFMAVMLFLTMTISAALPSLAFAAEDSADAKAVKFLTALDIIKTDEKTGMFWDETPVKRGEMAEIMCKMLFLDTKTSETPMFVDMNDSNRAYIETVVREGYMSGYSDTTFGTEDYITNQQAIKIMVSLLNGDSFANCMGGYPEGYIKAASTIGLLKGVSVAAESPARRIDIAKLIYKTLHQPMIEISFKNGNPVYNFNDGEMFMTDKLDIYSYSGVITKNAVTGLTHASGLGKDKVQIDDVICYDTNRIADDYFGMNVTVFARYENSTDDYGNIIYIEDKNNNVVVIDDEDIISVSRDEVSYEKKRKEKKVKLSSVADMIVNGTAVDFEAEKLKVKDGELKLIDNDNDNKYDVAIITEYKVYVVDSVNTNEELIMLQYSEPLISLEDTDYEIYSDGKRIELSELTRGAVISVVEGNNNEGKVLRIYACADKITGQVTSTSMGDMKAVINGEEYTLSDYYTVLRQKGRVGEIKGGYGGTFYLNIRGEVVFGTQSKETSVGYLIRANVYEEGDVGVRIKMFTEKGAFEYFDFADKVIINGKAVTLGKIQQNTDVMNRLSIKQLVEYDESDGVISRMELPGDEPARDDTKFSLDVVDSLGITSTGLLNYRYQVNNQTKVFVVPNNSNYYDDEGQYAVKTGSYFAGTKRTAWLYDVGEYGEVKYAIATRDPQWSEIGNGNALVVVTDIYEGVNKNGDIVTFIEGIAEDGVAATYQAEDWSKVRKVVRKRTYDEYGNATPSTAYVNDLTLQKGDIIQYKNNYKWYLHAVLLQQPLPDEETAFYTQEKLETGSDASWIAKVVYGKVTKNNGSQLLLSCSESASETDTVYDVDQLITNNGKALFLVESSGSQTTVTAMDFKDIVPGDRMYACLATNNVARMLVVYR